MPIGLGLSLAGAADTLMNLGSVGYNLWANKKDRDYQQALQQQIFQREDTAVQRRRADLEKAGFNPALAAGSPAQAGPAVSRSNTNDINPGSTLDTMAAVQQIKSQKLQNNIAEAEDRKANAEAAEVVYKVMAKMGLHPTPYIYKGKIGISYGDDRVSSSWSNYYDEEIGESRRTWERKEEKFQSDMNEALSRINQITSNINLTTADIQDIYHKMGLETQEFALELQKFGFDISKFNFNSTLETYQELRKQLESAADQSEKRAKIELYLTQQTKMKHDDARMWSQLILDTLGNPTKCFNILGMLGML